MLGTVFRDRKGFDVSTVCGGTVVGVGREAIIGDGASEEIEARAGEGGITGDKVGDGKDVRPEKGRITGDAAGDGNSVRGGIDTETGLIFCASS